MSGPHCTDPGCTDPSCTRLPEIVEWTEGLLDDLIAKVPHAARRSYAAEVEALAERIVDLIPAQCSIRVSLASLALALGAVTKSVIATGQERARRPAQPD